MYASHKQILPQGLTALSLTDPNLAAEGRTDPQGYSEFIFGHALAKTNHGEQPFLSLSSTWQFLTILLPHRDCLDLQIWGYVQAKSASWQQWRHWIEAAALVGIKIQGWIPFNEMYISYTHNPCQKNTNRLLLRYWQNKSFTRQGKAWTFSCTVCVDCNTDCWFFLRRLCGPAMGWAGQPGGHHERKFQGRRRAALTARCCQYLSIHCYITWKQLVLGSD